MTEELQQARSAFKKKEEGLLNDLKAVRDEKAGIEKENRKRFSSRTRGMALRASRPARLRQAEIVSARDRLGAAAHAQLVIDVAGMFFDRAHRDHQLAGDLGIGMPLADQTRDL